MQNPGTSLVTRYWEEHAEAKARLDRMVADAAATKTSLPDNYWQHEHMARRKLRICLELEAALTDE